MKTSFKCRPLDSRRLMIDVSVIDVLETAVSSTKSDTLMKLFALIIRKHIFRIFLTAQNFSLLDRTV